MSEGLYTSNNPNVWVQHEWWGKLRTVLWSSSLRLAEWNSPCRCMACNLERGWTYGGDGP